MNKIYTKICEFKFKNNKYLLLIDEFHKQFFLKILEDGNYAYITDIEFLELCKIFNKRPIAYNANKDKVKLIPKIISLAAGSAIILNMTACSYLYQIESSNLQNNDKSSIGIAIDDYMASQKNSLDSVTSEQENSETSTNDELEQSKINNNENRRIQELLDSVSRTEERRYNDGKLKLDSYIESPFSDNVYVFDTQYLDNVLDYKKEDITFDKLREVVKNNNGISDKFKELLYKYISFTEKEYSNVDLRIFYHNLKSLNVIECDKWELLSVSMSADSYGCYKKDENNVYVLKDYEYNPGTWEYQVIMHEFSHVARCGWWNLNGKSIRVAFEDSDFFGTTIEEAMNSLYTIRLYDKEELDIAYQLQSNYLELMLNNMDNYHLEDYINHNISYLENQLNEYNKNEDAVKILALIETQYKDYHDDSIEIEQSEFYPIYDYISNMVFKNNLHSGMSYDDAKKVCDYMIYRMTYDVPEEYNIDTNHIYEYFDSYCNNLGITKTLSR